MESLSLLKVRTTGGREKEGTKKGTRTQMGVFVTEILGR